MVQGKRADPPIIDVFKLGIFPPADVLPMLTPDELEDLADDIKVNGQREPIVIAKVAEELVLVDGRNRRAACKLAGVEPIVHNLNGADPLAYVNSMDLRRNVTTGQKAMAYAVRNPEPETVEEAGKKGGKAKAVGKKASSPDPDRYPKALKQRISEARKVLAMYPQWTIGQPVPETVAKVLKGSMKLDAAVIEAKKKEREAKQEEDDRVLLQENAPDLLQRVADEELTLEEAVVLFKSRDAENRSRRQSLFMGLREAARALEGFSSSDMLPKLPELLKVPSYRKEFVAEVEIEPGELRATMAKMQRELDVLRSIVEAIDGEGN